jgi:hypothetical protein
MSEKKDVEKIGKVAVFYIPSKKLGRETSKSIHDFLVNNYKAYTHEKGGMKGYWMDGPRMTKDHHERYEVSFEGDGNFKKLVDFLSIICKKTREEAIYLTISGDSYLVRPHKT